MNKKLIAIIGAVVVIVIVGIVLGVTIGGKKVSSPATSSKAGDKVTYTAIKACDLFTLDEAKQILGDGATAGDNDSSPASSDDVSVDTCTYTTTGQKLSDSKGASVLVRSPLTKDGVSGNKDGFDSQKPANAQDVSGYGDAAYFAPTYGQLNVYKGGAWYIITNGPAFNPGQSTVADAELVAEKVFN